MLKALLAQQTKPAGCGTSSCTPASHQANLTTQPKQVPSADTTNQLQLM